MDLPRLLRAGGIIAVIFAATMIGAIVLTGLLSKPPPTIAEQLRTLAPSERQALEALCSGAGFRVEELSTLRPGEQAQMPRSVAIERNRVRALRIADSPLADMSPVAAFGALESLWLDGNQLTEIAGVGDLPHLRELIVARNALTTLEAPLPPDLRVLDVSGNQLASLTELDQAKTLERLFAAKNLLTSLDELGGSPALWEITLDDNQITAIESVIDSPQLEKLSVRRNRIEALPEQLPKRPSMRVALDGNPVHEQPGHLWEHTFTPAAAAPQVQQQGTLSGAQTNVTGTCEKLVAPAEIELPAASGDQPGRVVVEVEVAKGRVRLFLYAPSDWGGPWYEKGHVEGQTGTRRKLHYVFADAAPGQPVKLRGGLPQSSSGKGALCLQLQPLDGQPAEEIRYRITAAP